MIDILNTSNIEIFIILIIPGFISLKIWSLLNPTKRFKISEIIYEILCYSFINFTLLLYIVYLIEKNKNNHIIYFSLWFIVLFIGPIIWPILLKKILNIQFIKKRILNPIPSSWDYFFIKREVCFILIHLRNGSLIGGLYRKQSYSSAYPIQKDLYLKETWKVDKDGHFLEKIKNTKGLYITYNEITYLEFFDAIPKK